MQSACSSAACYYYVEFLAEDGGMERVFVFAYAYYWFVIGDLGGAMRGVTCGRIPALRLPSLLGWA